MGIFSKIFGDSAPKKQPVSLTDANFHQEVLKSDIPVLVDVWSDGCPPCKQLEPIVMRLAGKYDGKVKVCELHPSRGPKMLRKLNIRGTPTVLYYRKGVLVERIVGFKGSLYHEDIIQHLLQQDETAAAT